MRKGWHQREGCAQGNFGGVCPREVWRDVPKGSWRDVRAPFDAPKRMEALLIMAAACGEPVRVAKKSDAKAGGAKLHEGLAHGGAVIIAECLRVEEGEGQRDLVSEVVEGRFGEMCGGVERCVWGSEEI